MAANDPTRTRAELNAALLDATAARADLDVVMALLRAGADLECSCPPEEGGFRPLHLALRGARQRSPELVSALLGAGADPNARASGGQTPLHVALGTTEQPWSEDSASVKSLINAGADPNISNRLGHTPLMYAASHTYDAVGILLAAGSDLVARDCDGWTALEWAIASGLTTDPLTRAAGRRSDYAKEEEFLQHETPRGFDPDDGGNVAVPPALSARVADYLASGHALLEYAPPDGCWTDGVWAWRDSAIETARMSALRLPGALLARMESAQYRVPFLDPMKLYVKTGLYLSATGGTYAMRRSKFEYLHAHFCRFPDAGPTEQLEIASKVSGAKPFKYEAPADLPDSATPEIARLREVVGATTVRLKHEMNQSIKYGGLNAQEFYALYYLDNEQSMELGRELINIRKVWGVFPDWMMATCFLAACGLYFYLDGFGARLLTVAVMVFSAWNVAYQYGGYCGFARGFNDGHRSGVRRLFRVSKDDAADAEKRAIEMEMDAEIVRGLNKGRDQAAPR